MSQEISYLLNADLSIVDNVLSKWGKWYVNENKLPHLGYPKMTSFLKQPINTDKLYNTYSDDKVDNISELINKILCLNPLFLKIAILSYVTCKDCTVLEKAYTLINDNYNLGKNNETIRKKFKELEQNLKFYVQGLIHCYETN